MKSNAPKNRMMFLGGTIVTTIALFISFGMLAAPQAALAYAVGSNPSGITPGTTVGGSSSYNFGNSLQTLVSPFTNFFSNLKLNNSTTINTGGPVQSFPTVNLTPTLESGIQNTVSQWVSEFDNWFYGISGIQLSGIFYVLLNAISWTLGLAQQVVNWLLGLFH